MTSRRPLVVISGVFSELPQGDSVVGTTAGSVVAGSGLDGGGALDGGIRRFDVELAAAPSGLIFVGTGDNARLGNDGAAYALAASKISEDEAIALIVGLS
jgi:hypothetical protein